MRFFIILFVSCFALSGMAQPPEILSNVKSEKAKPVMDFLTYTHFSYQWGVDDNWDDVIAPSFFARYDESFSINSYSHQGFLIEKVKGKKVTAKIWGSEVVYVNEITFEVTKEGGQWYILPPKQEIEDTFINPWIEVKEEVEFDFSEINEQFDYRPEDYWNYEPKTLHWFELEDYQKIDFDSELPERPTSDKEAVVHDFLVKWVEGDDDTYKSFVLPSFITENNLESDEVNINAYSPNSFRIVKVDGDKIYAIVYGNDGAWAHEVLFEVAQEDRKWYISPKPIENPDDVSFVDPWIGIETYIK